MLAGTSAKAAEANAGHRWLCRFGIGISRRMWSLGFLATGRTVAEHWLQLLLFLFPKCILFNFTFLHFFFYEKNNEICLFLNLKFFFLIVQPNVQWQLCVFHWARGISPLLNRIPCPGDNNEHGLHSKRPAQLGSTHRRSVENIIT
jgi:hypothetical protein